MCLNEEMGNGHYIYEKYYTLNTVNITDFNIYICQENTIFTVLDLF